MASKTDLEESGTGSSTPISTREQQQQPEQQQPQPGPASSVLPSHAQREPQQSPMGPPPAPVSSAGTSGQNVKAKNNASPSLNSPANPSLSRNHSHNHHHPQHHHIQSQHPFPPLSPTIMAHTGSPSCMPELTTSTVPVRHPRPLTAAELHLELEKEQEAVVRPSFPPSPVSPFLHFAE